MKYWVQQILDLSALSARARLAVLMIAPLGVMTGVGLFSRGIFWSGEWALAIDWVNGILIIMGPVLTGITSHETQRVAGPEWRRLARQTRRPGSMVARIIAVSWLWGCTIWAISLIVALAVCLTQGTRGEFPAQAMIFGPVTLVFYVAYGAAVGALFPRLWAGPISAVSIFGIFYLGAGKFIPSFLVTGGSTGSLVGQTWDLTFGALSVGILLSAGLGLTLVSLIIAGQRSRPLMVAGFLSLLLAFCAVIALDRSGTSRIAYTTTPVPLRCTGQVVQTCLPVPDSTQLADLSKYIDANAKVLLSAGITLPTRFTVQIPGREIPADFGILKPATGEFREIQSQPGIVADYLTTPRACPAYFDPTATVEELPDAVFQAQMLISSWLRKQTQIADLENGLDREATQKWLKSPTSAQASWVRKTYGQLKACELSEISMPTMAIVR